MAEPSTASTIIAGLLGGISAALGGAAPIPAGTAAARPPVQAEIGVGAAPAIFGLPPQTILIGLAVLLGVLVLSRKLG